MSVPAPARGIARIRADSTPAAVVVAVTGGAALGVVVAGALTVLGVYGFTPVDSLLRGMRSPALRSVLWAGTVLGAAGVVWGAAAFRRMPTKLSRDQAVAGAVLGAQAVVLAAGALVFLARGNLAVFARNFLDFAEVRPQTGAFVNGAKNTLLLAIAGEGIGVALGLILAVLAISRRAVVRAPARVYINFLRGTPLVWQLSFGYFALLSLKVDVSTYVVAIGVFGLNTAAYAAEVFRAGIQSVERGQLDAARGLGMTYPQAMRYAIVPQALRRVVPPLMNEFVILIKDTSLVIFLGLTSVQRELMSVGREGYENSFNATFFLATAFGYLVISLPLIRLVNVVERRLRSGLVGVTGA